MVERRVKVSASPTSAALAGGLLIVPLVVLNAIVGNRIEPLFSLIRPDGHTTALEYVLLFAVLLLIPVGAFIALRPMLRPAAKGQRRIYLVNGLVAAIMLVAFALISAGLGSDIYRCDVLQIPNCD